MPYQPRATYDNPYGPQVSFRTLDVLPPSAYYVGLDDQLVFRVYTDYSPAVFYFVARMLRPEGVIAVETVQLYNSQAGSQQLTGELTGVEGYVLSISASAPQVPLSAAYVTVKLMRAPYLITGLTTALLLAGYVGDKLTLSYPTFPPRGPLEGPGRLVTVTASPAAGMDWIIAVPTYVRWRVNIAWFGLTTTPTVISRQPNVILKDAANTTVGFCPGPLQQPASEAITYSLLPGGSYLSVGALCSISAPAELLLDAGGSISTYTPTLQPGDQYSSVAVQVEEWVGI